MNPENDRLRKALGIDVWHSKGYTGAGMVLGSAEDFGHAGKYEHAYQTYAVIKEVAPDAEVLYIPGEGYCDDRYMERQIPTMIERGVCGWTSALIGTYFDKAMDAAFDKVKDFCTMLIAVGNDGEGGEPAGSSRAAHVYGVGAAMLIVGQTVPVPEYFSTTSEHVDFACLDRWWIGNAQCTGTSFASPALCGMVALINQFFKAKTSKVLSSEAMYRFLKDNSRDLCESGKDNKTGWGYVVLPDPDKIRVEDYVPTDAAPTETEDKDMSDSKIKGIDVSEHQGVIDWEAAKESIDFAIIRAGYGQNNIDKQFKRNISECNRLGIPCGVYWFSYAYTADMAAKEAGYCLAAIKPYKLEYPVYFDLEYDTVSFAARKGVIIGKTLASAMVRAFCGACEAAGYWAGNYTNADYASRMFDTDIMSRYALWYAWYKDTCNRKNAGLWQHSSTGNVPGIIGKVDCNFANMDYPAIILAAGGNGLTATETPAAPAEPEPAPVVTKPDAVTAAVNKIVAAGHGDIIVQLAALID